MEDVYYALIAKEIQMDLSEEDRIKLELWRSESEKNEKSYLAIRKLYLSDSAPYHVPEIKLPPLGRPKYVWIATAVVFWGLFFFFYPTKQTLDTNPQALQLNAHSYETVFTKDGIKEVLLPDGSMVDLNRHSSLKFLRGFKGEERRVYLSGEAYFRVVSTGKPFIVEAGQTETTVLGTEFLLKTTAEKTILEVREGRVKFKSVETQNNAILTQGKTIASLSGKLEHIKPITLYKIAPWAPKHYTFVQTSLFEMAQKLTADFGLSIRFESKEIEQLHFTGKFKETDLKKILENMAFTFNLSIEKGPDYYRLKSKK